MRLIATTKQFDYKNYAEFEKHWNKIQEDNQTRTANKRMCLMEHYPIGGATEEFEYTYTAIYAYGRCI